MFKFLTLAFLGVVTCFSEEEALSLKSAGTSLQAYKDSKAKYEKYDKANKAFLDQEGKTNKLKAGLAVAQKKYNGLKKISDDLAKKEKKEAGTAKKSKAALAKLVKKDKKMKNKDTKAANKKHAANTKALKATQDKLKKAKTATTAEKKILAKVQKKYDDSAKKLKGLKSKVGNEVKKPKGKTALSILNKIVLKEKDPLFAEVSVTYKSTSKEFGAFIKTLGHEAAFWKALAKEVKADKKKKVLTAGAKMFLAANTKFEKACKAQEKLVKAKTAKKGKKAFKKATGVYKAEVLKSTVAIGKAMKTYESKKNQKIIKGYLKQYKKVEKHQVKLNQKAAAAEGGSTMYIVLGVVCAGIGAAAIWWFACRKKEE